MAYLPIIGLEIHVELKANSKMFCQCSADFFGKEPNTQVCPVCLGLPGALPVPNKKAVEWTILLAKALNCRINSFSKFDRKHYFYPDLPKGYQISQYDQPIASNGQFPISNFQFSKTIRIRRVHLEEDTGKLIHLGKDTLVDFNRSGVPLVEIVTEPDFNNSDDVKRFLEELQVLIRYLEISDADMEKGSMRLEPNISIIKITNDKLQMTNKYQISNIKYQNNLPNYKVEIKNINSFRFVKQAVDYEIKRQIELLEKGIIPKQETRGFDSTKGITFSQRIKEEAEDYRYFPEPDIPPMIFSQDYLNQIKLPELPFEKVEKYIKDFGLKYQDAFILTRDRKTANYFEKVILKLKVESASWRKKLPLKNQNLSQLVANLIINKKISISITIDEFVKKVLDLITPKETDEKLIEELINKVIETNKKAVDDYKKGKKNALMFLVGQVMREIKGKAEVKIVIEKLKEKLS